MVNNYLKIAFRLLWKNGWQTLINVSGLGVGIACCVLIILYVHSELTFDSFHSRADRIYRAWFKVDNGHGQVSTRTTTPFPMAAALEANFEEVESAVRVSPIFPWIKIDGEQFTERVNFVERNFFQVFDFPLSDGGRIDFVLEPKDAIITSSKAAKLFGEGDLINRNISIQIGQNFEDFTIRAVVADAPTNSSIQFDILISDANLEKLYSQQTLNSDWVRGFPETYVLLNEGTAPELIHDKISTAAKNLLGPDFKGTYEVGLQRIRDIHLSKELPSSFTPSGDIRHSYILAGIGFLILFMACINFITLSIGMSLNRAKEVGLRKTIGAQRRQLIFQFVGEVMIVTILSLIFGFIIALYCLPLFNELSGKRLSLDLSGIVILSGVSLFILIGLIAGSYPAFFLSNLKPVVVFRQKVQSASKHGLRTTLVGIQLTLSIFLISSTLIMDKQLNYVQNKNLGFDRDSLIVVELNIPRTGNLSPLVDAGFDKAAQFRNELSRYQNLEVFCAMYDFGRGNWMSIGFTDEQGVSRNFNINVVDERFIPALDIKLVEGRNFSIANPADAQRAIIVNEAFVSEYGLKDPIGKMIPGKKFAEHEIIGVVKNFNYASLYKKVDPLILTMNLFLPLSGQESIAINSSPIPKLMIKQRSGKAEETVVHLRTAWDKLSSNEQLSFLHVDENLKAQYRNDQQLRKIVNIACLIAIFIGGLGLYALASLSMQGRAKEISVRKVFGASERSLMILLGKAYLYLIIVSIAISVPMTLYFMDRWLESFEYRISPGWNILAMTSAIAILLGSLAISYQTIRVARMQPARVLNQD